MKRFLAWLRGEERTPDPPRWCGCAGYSIPQVELLMHETRTHVESGGGVRRVDICHRRRVWREVRYAHSREQS